MKILVKLVLKTNVYYFFYLLLLHCYFYHGSWPLTLVLRCVAFDIGALHYLQKLGVIDIGSNSVRMVVFDGAARSPSYFYNEKILCGLGLGLVTSGKLNPEGKLRAISAIERFVNITSALVPLGCFCAPIVERLIDQLGFGWTAQAIAAAGIAQSLIMLSSSLPLQYAAAAIFLVYRANVFAFPPTFAGQIFGPRTCGKFHLFYFFLMWKEGSAYDVFKPLIILIYYEEKPDRFTIY